MHKFDRGQPPVDFSKYVGENWDSFSATEDHRTLSDALYARQDGYCAYCESFLQSKECGHIEHLERRSEHPEKTFDWHNLFFSCLRRTSCGKYKDEHKPKITFHRADIVDPSRENPADFFFFDMTGTIHPKEGSGKHRAKETIRVLNLNDPGLVQQRKCAGATLSSYFGATDAVKDEFLAFLAANRVPFLFFYSSMLNRI